MPVLHTIESKKVTPNNMLTFAKKEISLNDRLVQKTQLLAVIYIIFVDTQSGLGGDGSNPDFARIPILVEIIFRALQIKQIPIKGNMVRRFDRNDDCLSRYDTNFSISMINIQIFVADLWAMDLDLGYKVRHAPPAKKMK